MLNLHSIILVKLLPLHDSEKGTMLNNFFSSCFKQSIPAVSPSSGSERLDPIDCPPELLCTVYLHQG